MCGDFQGERKLRISEKKQRNGRTGSCIPAVHMEWSDLDHAQGICPDGLKIACSQQGKFRITTVRLIVIIKTFDSPVYMYQR